MGQQYRVSAVAREGFDYYWRGTPPRPWPRDRVPGVLVEVVDQDDDPDPQNTVVPPDDTVIRIGKKSWAEIQADKEIRTAVDGSPQTETELRARIAALEAQLAGGGGPSGGGDDPHPPAERRTRSK